MYIGWLLLCAGAAAQRLDGKVRFPEERDPRSQGEPALSPPADGEGFYSRSGAGRYRVSVENSPRDGVPPRDGVLPRDGGPRRDPAAYRVDPDAVYAVLHRQNNRVTADDPADGTLDALQYCKCVSTPECTPRTDLPNACGAGKLLCCYTKKPNPPQRSESEVFNDIDDEHAVSGSERADAHDPFQHNFEQPIQRRPDVLVGPGGPTGHIGPQGSLLEELEQEALGLGSAQRGVLVGPGGPTGYIGPQRGVLVGPGGPTGSVGPREYSNGGYNNGGFGRPAILVGPGGPTGLIGPARRPVLVGPGGPTGVIGPWYRQRGSQTQPLLVGPNGRFRADGERQRYGFGQ